MIIQLIDTRCSPYGTDYPQGSEALSWHIFICYQYSCWGSAFACIRLFVFFNVCACHVVCPSEARSTRCNDTAPIDWLMMPNGASESRHLRYSQHRGTPQVAMINDIAGSVVYGWCGGHQAARTRLKSAVQSTTQLEQPELESWEVFEQFLGSSEGINTPVKSPISPIQSHPQPRIPRNFTNHQSSTLYLDLQLKSKFDHHEVHQCDYSLPHRPRCCYAWHWKGKTSGLSSMQRLLRWKLYLQIFH